MHIIRTKFKIRFSMKLFSGNQSTSSQKFLNFLQSFGASSHDDAFTIPILVFTSVQLIFVAFKFVFKILSKQLSISLTFTTIIYLQMSFLDPFVSYKNISSSTFTSTITYTRTKQLALQVYIITTCKIISSTFTFTKLKFR